MIAEILSGLQTWANKYTVPGVTLSKFYSFPNQTKLRATFHGIRCSTVCGFCEDRRMRGDVILDVGTIHLFYCLLGLKMKLLCCNSLSMKQLEMETLIFSGSSSLCVCVCWNQLYFWNCPVGGIKCVEAPDRFLPLLISRMHPHTLTRTLPHFLL